MTTHAQAATPKPGPRVSTATRPIEHYLTGERLAPYIAEASGDQSRALELYEWNHLLGAAFQKDLGHLEVAMRNAIDTRLIEIWGRRGWGEDWIDDPDGRLGRDPVAGHRQPYASIAEARERAERGRGEVTRHQVISETSFGLWAQLVSKTHQYIWPDLATAFPYTPNRDQATVRVPVGRLRTFRNRVAHHQKLFTKRPSDHHDLVLQLAGYIDPTVKAWIGDRSFVPTVMKRRPLLGD